MNNIGKFITIEGIEGAGKSTAVNFIRDWFESKKINYILTREPGGTEIAEEIREILLCHHKEKLTAEAEVLLFFAGRSQNIHQMILPALQKEQWVLCDRFVDASFAYQGGGRQLPLEFLNCLEKYVLDDLYPDLTLLMDVPIEIGLSRIKNRGEEDRIESERIEFFERVRTMYLKRAKQYPDRYRIVDASGTIETVKHAIEEKLNEFFRIE